MKVFYFKEQSITDKKRDENGIIETQVDEKGKVHTEDDDYYSIQVKIPKRDCTIDWRKYVRWSKFYLLTEEEFKSLESGTDLGDMKQLWSEFDLLQSSVLSFGKILKEMNEDYKSESREA